MRTPRNRPNAPSCRAISYPTRTIEEDVIVLLVLVPPAFIRVLITSNGHVTIPQTIPDVTPQIAAPVGEILLSLLLLLWILLLSLFEIVEDDNLI